MKWIEQPVPTEWSMFTAAGNARLRQLASDLKMNIHGISQTDFGKNYYVLGKGPRSAEKRQYRKFFLAYQRMNNFKSYREAGDTAVRECVWCFALECSDYTQLVPRNELDEVWESASNEAYFTRKAKLAKSK